MNTIGTNFTTLITNPTIIFLVISVLLNILFIARYDKIFDRHAEEIKAKDQLIDTLENDKKNRDSLESDIAEYVVIFREIDQIAKMFDKFLSDHSIDYSNYLEEFQAIEELSRKIYEFGEKGYCDHLFNAMDLAEKIEKKVPKRNSAKELEYIVQHVLDKKFKDIPKEIPTEVIFEDQLH